MAWQATAAQGLNRLTEKGRTPMFSLWKIFLCHRRSMQRLRTDTLEVCLYGYELNVELLEVSYLETTRNRRNSLIWLIRLMTVVISSEF